MAYYNVPKGYADCDDMLAHLCEDGLARRIPDADDDTRARVQHELAIIREKCVADYILTAWDIVKYAKEHGICVGPGRDTSACSLVNYLVGITDVNPLKFALPFERFLSTNDNCCPHINIDVSNCEDLEHYVKVNGFPLRINILKLGWLQVIKHALDTLKHKGVPLDINSIPLDDRATLNLFKKSDVREIFQFGSPAMWNYLSQMKSVNFSDLVALNSLGCPGRTDWIPEFLKRKNRYSKDRNFEDILSETYGLLIYQEQAMQIIHRMTGFTLGWCYQIRRILAKKNPDHLVKLEPDFFAASDSRGYDRKTISRMWELLFSKSGLLFNKSHAVAYTLISFQTAYLAAHHEAEYQAAYAACRYSRMYDGFTA